jgi:hypothetical protein
MSKFRHRLWKQRDELHDEIRAGLYRDPSQARKLEREIEAAIECAPEFSVLRAFVLRTTYRSVRRPAFSPACTSGLNASDRMLLEPRIKAFHRAITVHALTGTPSGWITTAVLIPYALVTVVIERHRNRSVLVAAKTKISSEVALQGTLAHACATSTGVPCAA